MKKLAVYYWVFTGLFAAMMLFTAIPNIIMNADSVDLISTKMGYPQYLIHFIGIMKTLGVIALLIPGFPRVKEWAYAGLFFDLGTAIFSFYMIGTPLLMCLPMLIFVIPGVLSYIFYHKRLQAAA